MLLTSALPYINGVIHIGHIYEFCLLKFYLNLYNFFSNCNYYTGLDCHGLIKKVKIKKIFFLNLKKIKFYELNFKLKKTNTLINKRITNWFYIVLNDKNYIIGKTNLKYYNLKKKIFIPDKYIEFYCFCCKRKLIEFYCFKCKSYKNNYFIKTKININNIIVKIQYSLFMKTYIYNDWDFSRINKYKGFKIISKKKYFFYVWFDALISYISNNLFIFKNLNIKIIQIFGKDIYYFHKIFKIILNIVLNLKTNILIHGFILYKKKKISKSKKKCKNINFNIFYLKFFFFLKNNNINDIIIKDVNLLFKKYFLNKIFNTYFRIRAILTKYDNKSIENYFFYKKHKLHYYFLKKKKIENIIKKIIFELENINKKINKNYIWKRKNFFLIQYICTKLIKIITSKINIINLIINNKLINNIKINDIMYKIVKIYEN